MIYRAVLHCTLYAILNVTGAAIIKFRLSGITISGIESWLKFLLGFEVVFAFILIFSSALVMFKALSVAAFSLTIPIATGINFALTIVTGIFIFNDKLNYISYIGFFLILSGIFILSLNSLYNAK